MVPRDGGIVTSMAIRARKAAGGAGAVGGVAGMGRSAGVPCQRAGRGRPGPAGAGSPGPDGGEAVRVECVLKLRTPLINTIEANIFHVRTRVGTFKGSQAVSGLGPPRAFSHGHRQAGILGPSHFTEPNAIFLIFALCTSIHPHHHHQP